MNSWLHMKPFKDVPWGRCLFVDGSLGRHFPILPICVTKNVASQSSRGFIFLRCHALREPRRFDGIPFQRTIRPLLALVFALLIAAAAAAPASAQEKKVAQKNGVDISKMGAYRALAQHIYGDFQKGDLAAAAELSTVLERLWDKAEEYGGDTALAKTNRQLFDEIDKAMDQFITPFIEAKGKPPDPARTKAAFNAYMEKLKLAD
jgi:hypothetical protein